MRLSLFLPYCLVTLALAACGGSSGGGSDAPSPHNDSVSTPVSSTETGLASSDPGSSVEASSPAPEAEEVKGLPILYFSEELQATKEVFQDYGELTIDPSLIDSGTSSVVKVPDADIPWAAYWYPKREEQLFDGTSSPMSKLDDYLKKYGIAKSAQAWEKSNYNPNAAEWEGLCDAWAVASVLTKEPKAKIRELGIEFTPSDLKAIAIKYFEGYPSKIYGRRYLGIAATDGLIQDLRPEAFHKLAEVVIGEQRKPLIIDEDPGPEIWSKPVFRMSFSYTKDPEHENAVIVKAFPWMIRQRSEVNDEPTTIAKDLAAPQYEYRLYYEPNTFPLRVVAGEWIGASINFHPDMVFLPTTSVNAKQYNTGVQQNNDMIRKLLVKVGMLSE